jgi:hypothetical protein
VARRDRRRRAARTPRQLRRISGALRRVPVSDWASNRRRRCGTR